MRELLDDIRGLIREDPLVAAVAGVAVALLGWGLIGGLTFGRLF